MNKSATSQAVVRELLALLPFQLQRLQRPPFCDDPRVQFVVVHRTPFPTLSGNGWRLARPRHLGVRPRLPAPPRRAAQRVRRARTATRRRRTVAALLVCATVAQRRPGAGGRGAHALAPRLARRAARAPRHRAARARAAGARGARGRGARWGLPLPALLQRARHVGRPARRRPAGRRLRRRPRAPRRLRRAAAPGPLEQLGGAGRAGAAWLAGDVRGGSRSRDTAEPLPARGHSLREGCPSTRFCGASARERRACCGTRASSRCLR